MLNHLDLHAYTSYVNFEFYPTVTSQKIDLNINTILYNISDARHASKILTTDVAKIHTFSWIN